MEIEAEVFKQEGDVYGEVSFQLEGEKKAMKFLCKRITPCDWEVLKQWFGPQEINPTDYDNLSGIRLPSLTGALEEKYQAIYALEQDNK